MADEDVREPGRTRRSLLVETIFPWLVLIGGGLFVGVFLFGGAIAMLYNSLLVGQAMANVPATLGLPCAALVSLCLVVFLKTTNGPIEFDALGFKFKGASGPIVMWVLCFLAMVFAIHLLWKDTGITASQTIQYISKRPFP